VPPPALLMLRLSVVVVAINREGLLSACLDALLRDAEPHVEVLVVRDRERVPRPAHEDPSSHVGPRWIDAPPDATVPRMRALGIRAARADVVALIEDDCIVSRGWCRGIIEAHRGADVAIGGPVEPGPYRRAADWAVYFHEYGRFMSPMPRGAMLSGTNVAYKRAAILEALGPDDALYDVELHRAWARAGRPMSADDRLAVVNVNSWPRSHLTRVPFHHGRAFAAQRFSTLPGGARLGRAVLTLFLPLLQVARMIALIVTRHRHLMRFVQALPAIVVFAASWSAGEIAGCLCGDGGSAARWR
jgi:hypothetical protein